MKPRSLTSVAVAAGLLLVSASVNAHHGTSASYDLKTPMELSGTVTEFVWENPHARIFVDVTDQQEKVVNWGIEMRPAPNGLSRAGWTRHMFQKGDKITITVFPSRFGTAAGVGEPNYPILKNGQLVPGTGTRGRQGGVGRGV